jgi:hypothetical protein
MIHKADKQLKEKWSAVFNGLPLEAKIALKIALQDLKTDAGERAKYSWKKHKAPMALYWKVISVYSGHLIRSIK